MASQSSQVMDKEETEKEIKVLSDEYNASAELLNNAEVKLNEAKDKCFRVLRDLYKEIKDNSSSSRSKNVISEKLYDLEESYNESEVEITKAQTLHYELTQSCFRRLQKLRLLQTNYLVAIINSLQKEVNEFKQNSSNQYSVEELSKSSVSKERGDNLS